MRTVPDAMNISLNERSMFMIFGLLSRVIIPPLSRTLISALQPGLASWFLMFVLQRVTKPTLNLTLIVNLPMSLT